MISKAVIRKMIDNYTACVLIPTINNSSGSSSYTGDDSLYTATICCQPGVIPNYQPGDIVFVAFEDGLEENPVIVGSLYKESGIPKGSIDSVTIYSESSCYLPSDTTIGNANNEDLNNISNTHGNLQFQIDILSQRLDKLGG